MKLLTIFAAILISGIAEADSVVTLHCEGTFVIHTDTMRANRYTTDKLRFKHPYDGSWDLEINLDKKELSQGKHSGIPFVRAGNTVSWELLHVRDIVFWQYSLGSVSAELIGTSWVNASDSDDPSSWEHRIERWEKVYRQAHQNHYSCKKVDKLF